MKRLFVLLSLAVMIGCAKHPVSAPVPGSINTLDAWAFRSISDATASIHSVKTWEQCTTDPSSPKTVVVDGTTENCDPTATPFPVQFRSDLNAAIQALNAAAAVGKAYHSGASQDSQGLTFAIAQLNAAVTGLMAHVGGTK